MITMTEDDGLLESFSSPTDRSAAAPARARFEGIPSERLRREMFEAYREERIADGRAIRHELQARAADRQREEATMLERRQLDLDRVQAEAAARGHRCDYTPQGCPCKGFMGYEHERFLADLRRPVITAETKALVAAVLGYPCPGKRIGAIFSSARGGGSPLPGFEWSVGATEEDWLEVLNIAAKRGAGAAVRNARDGSVREGWIRVILQQVMARARAHAAGGKELEHALA